VARDLLGTRLVSTLGGERTEGVIVETEAYLGAEDPASHAATRRGRTERNAAMFGPPGRAYVYFIYGVHWCLNVVTGAPGEAQAVLLRGLEPLGGRSIMARRRGRDAELTSGPGRLCQALAVDGDLYGHDLLRPPLLILPGWHVPDDRVAVTGRVGVRAAADRPLRFLVEGSRGVSRPVRAAEGGRGPAGPEGSGTV
jgi:DNA-3-methyladenine glycosylase